MLALAVQLWSEGMSDPTVVSDETVIKGLMQIGTPLEDALDYTMLGCQEIEIPGKSNFGCEDGQFNLAKLFEYAMNGGMSTSNPAVRVGPEGLKILHALRTSFRHLRYSSDILSEYSAICVTAGRRYARPTLPSW